MKQLSEVDELVIQKKIFGRLCTSIVSIILIFALIIYKRAIVSSANLAMIVIAVSLFIVYTVWQSSKISCDEKDFQINDFFSMLFSACLILQFFFAVCYYKPVVDGRSMLPTLTNGQNLIVRSTNKNIKFGDIVVLALDKDINNLSNYVDKDDELIIKRVIGLSGDTVYCSGNQVYVNGIAIVENYLDENEYTSDFNMAMIINKNHGLSAENLVIPEDYYLVLGDNRNESSDSRFFGLFHKSQIVGIAKYKMGKNIFDWSEVK